MPEMPSGINYYPTIENNDSVTFTAPVEAETYTPSNTSAVVSGYGTYYSVDTTPSVSPAEVGNEAVKLTKEQEKAAAGIEKLLNADGQVTFEKVEKLFDSIGFDYKGNDVLIVNNKYIIRSGWSKDAANILNEMLKRGTIKLTDSKGKSYNEVMSLPASATVFSGLTELNVKIELC